MDDDVRVDVVKTPAGDVLAVPAGRGDRNGDDGLSSRDLLVLFVAAVALAVVSAAFDVWLLAALLGLAALALGLFAPTLAVLEWVQNLRRDDPELLAADVSLAYARDHYDATPAPEASADVRGRDRSGEHAVEGETG